MRLVAAQPPGLARGPQAAVASPSPPPQEAEVIVAFTPGVRKTVVIGLEPEEARAILRGATVETGNEEMTFLVGRAAEIMAELRAASERTGTRLELHVRP